MGDDVSAGALDEWGDLVAMLDRATSHTLKRLDEEERAAGLAPW